MLLLTTRDSWWMSQCEATLLAKEVPSRWLPGPLNSQQLDVPASEAGRAAELLAQLLGEEQVRRRQQEPRLPQIPLLLQAPFAQAIGLALITIAFYWVTGPLRGGSQWFADGAYLPAPVMAGEWWRLITAATLHADGAHAVGNAGFFMVLGWAAAERFGVGWSLAVWLLTAVAGFVASLLFSDVGLSVGASGGLFGLLGAAGGHAARHRRDTPMPWRDRVRGFGGAVLLLAFTAFSPRANIHAHVGGFVAGLAVGAALPQVAPARPTQIVAAVAVCGAVLLAWVLA